MQEEDRRKMQLRTAKRRSQFKGMLQARLAMGKTYILPQEALINLFMAQPEETRMKGRVFLRGHESYTQLADEADTHIAIVDTQLKPTHNIPIETTQQELIDMIIRFFRVRAIAPDAIHRTLDAIAECVSGKGPDG